MKIYITITLSLLMSSIVAAEVDQKQNKQMAKQPQKTETAGDKDTQQAKPTVQNEIDRQIEQDMQKEIDMLVEIDNQETDTLVEKVQKAQQDKDDHVEAQMNKEIADAPEEQNKLLTFEEVYAKKDIEPKENK